MTGQATGLGPALRAWFTRPPRAHGEIDEDRTVSFLELFYDLVFVVLIAQAAHTLAGDVSWSGLLDFTVVFGLVWIAWFNGSMYHELHGREDGRSRTYIFIQMFLLVVLAVYAGHATDTDGQGFAIAYSLLLAILTLQWYVVRRYDSEEYMSTTARYLASMLAAMLVMTASAFVGADLRLVLWAALVVGWIASVLVQVAVNPNRSMGAMATDSMSERFGLFTIIVLGEVVVGVVDGISEAGATTVAMVTGLIALSIGFGFWWNYFDALGRRTPRPDNASYAAWVVGHLPLAGAIAAAGAGMVGLIEHADDAHTPIASAWLIGGASALLLVCLAGLMSTIDYDDVLAAIEPRIVAAMLVGALLSLVVAAAAPKAWLLALLLSGIHSAIWFYAFALRAREVSGSATASPG